MLQHVYERAGQSRYLRKLLIATDDERIREAARAFGAPVVMTRADHPSGTDRAAEAASMDDAEIVVNIQGDEPLIDPAAIDAAVLALLDDPDLPMASLKKRIEDPSEIANPNVVKVVCDLSGGAVYFSRHPIPFDRDNSGVPYFKHIGLYVYRRKFLLEYPSLPVGPLEKAERLEQLRAIENGFRIGMAETEYDSFGVDTQADRERVSGMLQMTFTNR